MSSKENRRKPFRLGRISSSAQSDSSSSFAPTFQSTSIFSRLTAKATRGRGNEKPEPPKSAPPSAIPYNSPSGGAKTSSVAIQQSLDDVAVGLPPTTPPPPPPPMSEIAPFNPTQYLNQALPPKPVISTATTSKARKGPIQRAQDAVSAPPFEAEQAPDAKSTLKSSGKSTQPIARGSLFSKALSTPGGSPPSADPDPRRPSITPRQVYSGSKLSRSTTGSDRPSIIKSATPDSGSPLPSVSLSTSIFREVKTSSASTSASLKEKAQGSPTVISSRAPAESNSAYPPDTPVLLNQSKSGIPAFAVNTDPNGIVIRVTTPASAQASRTTSKSTLLLNGGKPISLSTTLHQLKTSIAKLMDLENVQLSPQKLANSWKHCNCAFAESVARNGLWNMLRCRDHTEVACDYAHPDDPVNRKGSCALCLMDLVERCGDCQDAGFVTRDCCPLVVNAGCNHTFHHHCYTKQFRDTCPARCSTGPLPLILSILICKLPLSAR